MTRRLATAALATLALGLAVPSVAGAESQTQAFFTDKLLGDAKTGRNVGELLRGEGFVDRSVTFRDLTGDDKADALVRVQSGGIAGTVALYVFSIDTGRKGSELQAIYRTQRLYRASTRIADGVLTYTTARFAPGDEPCCPARLQQTTLRWDDGEHRFRIGSRAEVDGPRPPAALRPQRSRPSPR